MPRTGNIIYNDLEEVYVDNGESTGHTKSNNPSDPDYISPFEDLIHCPIDAEGGVTPEPGNNPPIINLLTCNAPPKNFSLNKDNPYQESFKMGLTAGIASIDYSVNFLEEIEDYVKIQVLYNNLVIKELSNLKQGDNGRLLFTYTPIGVLEDIIIKYTVTNKTIVDEEPPVEEISKISFYVKPGDIDLTDSLDGWKGTFQIKDNLGNVLKSVVITTLQKDSYLIDSFDINSLLVVGDTYGIFWEFQLYDDGSIIASKGRILIGLLDEQAKTNNDFVNINLSEGTNEIVLFIDEQI